MLCQFCGEERRLVRSHIIPECFYPFEEGPRQPLVLIRPDPEYRIGRSAAGEYDSEILCEQCERVFSPWDDAANRLFNDASKWSVFAQDGSNIVAFSAVADYRRIKLFFLSLLWRAHITNRPMFAHVSLGPWLPIVLEHLKTSEPGQPSDFSVFLERFTGLPLRGPILDPRREQFLRCTFYRFYLGEFIAHIKVDKRPTPQVFDGMCIAPDQPIVAIARAFEGSAEHEMFKEVARQIRERRLSGVAQ